MKPINIHQLNPVMLPLVQKLYKNHYRSAKAKKHEIIFVAYCENDLCGVVRLRKIDNYRLVTGLVVVPIYRGLGIAHHIMNHCRTHTLNDKDYCFSYSHLVPFYTQHHFITIEKNALPAPLENLYTRYSDNGKLLVPMHYTKTLNDTLDNQT